MYPIYLKYQTYPIYFPSKFQFPTIFQTSLYSCISLVHSRSVRASVDAQARACAHTCVGARARAGQIYVARPRMRVRVCAPTHACA